MKTKSDQNNLEWLIDKMEYGEVLTLTDSKGTAYFKKLHDGTLKEITNEMTTSDSLRNEDPK